MDDFDRALRLSASRISKASEKLRKGKKLSPKDLEAALRKDYDILISESSLKNYEITNPKEERYTKGFGMRIEYLYALADFYGVSTYYLLGNTNIKNPNPQMQAACKYTGISEPAINIVKNLGKDTDPYYYDTNGFKPPLLKVLNILYENGFIANLVEAIGHCLYQITVRDKFGSDRVLSIEEEQRITLPAIGRLSQEIDGEISEALIHYGMTLQDTIMAMWTRRIHHKKGRNICKI